MARQLAGRDVSPDDHARFAEQGRQMRKHAVIPVAGVRIRKLESLSFLALVLVTSVVFFWLIHPFLAAVFWAATCAVLFQQVHTRLLGFCGGRRAPAALLATVTVVLFVVLPLALVLAAIAQQGLQLYQDIASGRVNVQAPIDVIERMLPSTTTFLEHYGVNVAQLRVSLQDLAAELTHSIAAQALAAGRNALVLLVLFGLMLYLLFFFFRDGDRIVDGIMRVAPLGEDRKRRLLLKIAQVARATVKGTLIVAVAQGSLGAIIFALVGIRTAVFWGVLMAVLSLLPAIGAGLVWLPAAIILFASGQLWQPVVVLLGGVFVIGLVDNLLRPIVVGRDTKTPDYLVLISTLGGLAAFGLAGFVAGPLIAAAFLVLWDMFAEEYADTAVDRRAKHASAEHVVPPEDVVLHS
jgi:predicted PurR-regulated permease PerM